MKQITSIRKSVCIMANELKKAGYSLSEAFKKAWQRVKLSMTIRAAGCTFENGQERLGFLERFRMEDLRVTLEREPKNRYVHNLRHTFCPRFCENETNIKVIQEIMGHSDIGTTMNIYAEATEAKKKEAFKNLEGKIKIS